MTRNARIRPGGSSEPAAWRDRCAAAARSNAATASRAAVVDKALPPSVFTDVDASPARRFNHREALLANYGG